MVLRVYCGVVSSFVSVLCTEGNFMMFFSSSWTLSSGGMHSISPLRDRRELSLSSSFMNDGVRVAFVSLRFREISIDTLRLLAFRSICCSILACMTDNSGRLSSSPLFITLMGCGGGKLCLLRSIGPKANLLVASWNYGGVSSLVLLPLMMSETSKRRLATLG